MKTYLTSLKSSLFLVSLLISQPLLAAELIGKISAIKGEAFIVIDGQTKELKNNSDIYSGTQLLVSDEAEVSWNDFKDHLFHLNANSHVTVFKTEAKLVRGSLWIQSLKKEQNPFNVKTMNGIFESNSGEAILTYDTVLNKSQILVISGEATAAGILEPSFKFSLGAGQFTFLQPEFDQGLPRTPTKVGYDSLVSATKQFNLAKSMDKGLIAAGTPKREIASVDESQSSPKGEVTFIKTIVADGDAQKYYLNSVKAKKNVKPNTARKTNSVVVRIWGQSNTYSASPRNPASVKRKQIPVVEKSNNLDQEFLDSLKKHQVQQPIKSHEVQSLIDELKSF